MPKKIDPKERSFDSFKNLCGCFRCEKKNNGNGTWPSKEAIVYCDTQKTSMRKAYDSGTPFEPFICNYKVTKPFKPETVQA